MPALADQLDLFIIPKPPASSLLVLEAHASSEYRPRTLANAHAADVTVAFAVDFNTAGERLTARVAGRRYLAIAYDTNPAIAAEALLAKLRQAAASVLNVAGNGIYTLKTAGHTQADVNAWVYAVLKQVLVHTNLTCIRSGGQTGIDQAGLVSAVALGIPAVGLLPKGYRQRLADNRDVNRDVAELHREILQQARILKS